MIHITHRVVYNNKKSLQYNPYNNYTLYSIQYTVQYMSMRGWRRYTVLAQRKYGSRQIFQDIYKYI